MTNFTPWSTTKETMSGSRTKAWAMFTPNGLSVSVRIFLTSSRTASSSPDEVSMMPRPPALDTAEASCARAIQPIGACTMGYSTPSISVMRVLIMDVPGGFASCHKRRCARRKSTAGGPGSQPRATARQSR